MPPACSENSQQTRKYAIREEALFSLYDNQTRMTEWSYNIRTSFCLRKRTQTTPFWEYLMEWLFCLRPSHFMCSWAPSGPLMGSTFLSATCPQKHKDYHSVVLHLYSLWHVYEHIFRSSKGLPIPIWFIIPVLASEGTLASSLQAAIELPSSVYCLSHAKCYAPMASPRHETIPVQKWSKYPV